MDSIFVNHVPVMTPVRVTNDGTDYIFTVIILGNRTINQKAFFSDIKTFLFRGGSLFVYVLGVVLHP